LTWFDDHIFDAADVESGGERTAARWKHCSGVKLFEAKEV
jgi:hypothetical protein